MPRPPRFVVPGLPQHLIIRGNNRAPIFAAEGDYHAYLDWLLQASRKHECSVHAYVLMTNHVHLLVTPSTPQGLGKMVQMVGRYYVQYFNRRSRRTGTLWEGRYKASLVDSERYLLTCQRYIEVNPVRAKMVAHPADYPWSSYRVNALGQDSDLIAPHSLFEQLGATNEERRAAYRALFNREIPSSILDKIRDAANKGWALGDPDFLAQMESIFDRPTRRQPRGGDRRSERYRKQTGTDRN